MYNTDYCDISVPIVQIKKMILLLLLLLLFWWNSFIPYRKLDEVFTYNHMDLMYFQICSHIRASIVLTRADHLFINNYIRLLLNIILRPIFMIYIYIYIYIYMIRNSFSIKILLISSIFYLTNVIYHSNIDHYIKINLQMK